MRLQQLQAVSPGATSLDLLKEPLIWQLLLRCAACIWFMAKAVQRCVGSVAVLLLLLLSLLLQQQQAFYRGSWLCRCMLHLTVVG
jgi:hypothetical protein